MKDNLCRGDFDKCEEDAYLYLLRNWNVTVADLDLEVFWASYWVIRFHLLNPSLTSVNKSVGW